MTPRDTENLNPYGAQNHPLPPMKEEKPIPEPVEVRGRGGFFDCLFAAHRPLFLYTLLTLAYLVSAYHQNVLACIIFGIASLGALADTAQRMENYRTLLVEKRTFARVHLLRGLKSSWCGRGVLEHYDNGYKEALHKSGYRWWHIFPDDAPKVFITRQFWRDAIGI